MPYWPTEASFRPKLCMRWQKRGKNIKGFTTLLPYNYLATLFLIMASIFGNLSDEESDYQYSSEEESEDEGGVGKILE